MNDIERNLEQLYELMNSYKLTKEEQQDLLSLIIDIFNHDEFQYMKNLKNILKISKLHKKEVIFLISL